MAYGTANVDNIQSSTVGTPVVFKDGGGTQVGTLCRAWVNYKGVATRGINASFNVSSVTANGTGDYTFNFTNAMPDTNYSIAGMTTASGSTAINLYSSGGGGTAPTLKSTTQVRIITGGIDTYDTSVQIFR